MDASIRNQKCEAVNVTGDTDDVISDGDMVRVYLPSLMTTLKR